MKVLLDIPEHLWYNTVKEIERGRDKMNEITVNRMNSTLVTLNPDRVEYEYSRTLSKETRRTYISAIKDFFKADDLSDITVDMMKSVTPFDANDWAEGLLAAGNSKATINKKLGALHNFYSFLCRKTVGIMDYNPFSTEEGCIRYKNAIKPYSEKRALTPEEVNRIISAIEKPDDMFSEDYIVYLRDLLVIQMLCTTGMRREELADARIGDIMPNGGKHVIRIIGKGDKFRFAVLPDVVMNNIEEYMELRGITIKDKTCPIITSHSSRVESGTPVDAVTIYRIVKKYAKKSGVSVDGDIAPHNLRHTFATISLSMGADIADVQDMMGHSSINTTRRYDHINRTIQHSTSERLSAAYGIC